MMFCRQHLSFQMHQTAKPHIVHVNAAKVAILNTDLDF